MKSSSWIGPSLKVVFIPFSIILFTLTSLVFLIRFGFSEFNVRLGLVEKVNSEIKILSGKVELLREFKSSETSDKSDLVYVVLPDKNTAAVFLSQVRRVTGAKGVILTGINLKVVPSVKDENIEKAEIEMDFESKDRISMSGIFDDIKNVAPISTVEEIDISKMGDGTYKAKSKFLVYWSDLPDTLPSLTEPISSLSQDDLDMLSKLSQLEQPEYSNLSPEENTAQRSSPFN